MAEYCTASQLISLHWSMRRDIVTTSKLGGRLKGEERSVHNISLINFVSPLNIFRTVYLILKYFFKNRDYFKNLIISGENV